MSNYNKQRKNVAALQRIGTWATWWWAVSGVWIVALVWRGREFYPVNGHFSLSAWMRAVGDAFSASVMLRQALAVIALGWIVGCGFWLRELKRLKISYGEAFRDLFLTVRK